MKRTFIYTDDKSNKFWSIEVKGNGFTVTFGKLGTAGQSQTKSFSDEAACQKEANKLIGEKTKKGYVEQGEGAIANNAAAPESTQVKKEEGLKIPKYKVPRSAQDELASGEFIVDLKNPISIASVLQHHINDFDQFLEDIEDGSLDYGTWDGEEFDTHFTNHSYSEEPFFEAAVSFPELHPLIAQYVECCINATEGQQTGPWSTEETVLGEIAAYNLALADPAKYKSLFLRLKEASSEARFSAGIKQRFELYQNDIENEKKREPKVVEEKKDEYGFTKTDYLHASQILEAADIEGLKDLIAKGYPVAVACYPKWKSSEYSMIMIICKTIEELKKRDDLYEYLDRCDDMMVLLLENGAKTNSLENIIIDHGLNKTLTYLIDKGIYKDLNALLVRAEDRLGTGYFNKDQSATLELLINKGADPSKIATIVHRVACYSSNRLLRRLVEEFKLPIDSLAFPKSWTPLEFLDWYYDAYELEKEIPKEEKRAKSKATANKYNQFGRSAVMYVEMYHNHLENKEYLKGLQEKLMSSKKTLSQSEQTTLDHKLLEHCKVRFEQHVNFTEVREWQKQLAMLLKEGANPNIPYPDGSRIMHHITRHYYPSITKDTFEMLQKYGVEANVFDAERRTPLHYFFASYGGDTYETVGNLIKAGIDTAHKDKNGYTVLGYIANLYGNPTTEEDDFDEQKYVRNEVIKDMLYLGACPNNINPNNDNILHATARFDDDSEAEYFIKGAIQAGADINALNDDKETALLIAVQQAERSFTNRFITELIENGADVNLKDKEGNTPFHLSTHPKNDFSELLKGNPDVHYKNKAGKSVFDCIKESGIYQEKPESFYYEKIKKKVDELLAKK